MPGFDLPDPESRPGVQNLENGLPLHSPNKAAKAGGSARCAGNIASVHGAVLNGEGSAGSLSHKAAEIVVAYPAFGIINAAINMNVG